MPKYEASATWSSPISVQAGDVVQNTGWSIVLVCASGSPNDDDSIEIDPRKAIKVEGATSLRIRCRSGKSEVKVIGGL